MVKKYFLISLAALMVASLMAVPFSLANDENETETHDSEVSEVHTATAPSDCITKAVHDRMDTLKPARETFLTDLKKALETRQTSMEAARALTDKAARKDAIKKAQATFKDAFKTTRKGMKDARESARTNFRTELKACGVADGSQE